MGEAWTMDRKDLPSLAVERRIYEVRGQRVMVDSDIAELYGVSTKRLNEQVKRNADRFPDDFVFRLSDQEFKALRSQFATAKWAKRRSRPYAFTEHGAVMAANVITSDIAIEASIAIVRAFVKTRKILAEHADLKRRLSDLERRVAARFEEHEEELRAIRFAIQQLSLPPGSEKKRPVGFRPKGKK